MALSAAPFCPPNMNMFQAHYQNPKGPSYFGYPQPPYGFQGREGINPNMYTYPMPSADDRNAMYHLPPNLQMNPNMHMTHGMSMGPVIMSETGSQTSHGEFVVRNIAQQHQDTTCVTPSCHRSPPLSKCETTSPNMPELPSGSIAPALKLNYDYKGDVTVTTNSAEAPILCSDLKSEVESRSNCGSNYGAQAPQCQLSPAQIYAANAAANAARGYMPNYSMPPMLMGPGTGPRTEFAWLRTDRSHAVGAGTNSESASPQSMGDNPIVTDLRVRTKEKYRRVYSDNMRLELEKEFCTSKYITINRKTELAKTLGLTERQVKIWFQNRRAKERRSTGKTPLDQQADSGMYNNITAKLGFGMAGWHSNGDKMLQKFPNEFQEVMQ